MRRLPSALAGIAALLPLSACGSGSAREASLPRDADGFPVAARPVSAIDSDRGSSEKERDRLNESSLVMGKTGVKRGMTVADIGAGEGYYTVRLAARVGKRGRVLAEDIVPEVHDKLAERVSRERLDNVSVRLGDPANPKLPAASFDRVLMVHMYHEIAEPYRFLWNMRPALKPDGEVAVVEADRPAEHHGTPPALLDCEFRAVGYQEVRRIPMRAAGGYLALFRVTGPRPAPASIRPCDASGRAL